MAPSLKLASLREDYLSQVQRDFLSHVVSGAAPLAIGALQRLRILVDSVEGRRFNAQHLVQLGTGGRVLQMNLFVWEYERRRAKCGQRALMKAA